ncbi:telomere-associated protein RIF1-like [Pyrus x bretschneideri]|uniref:telomere-associated protein RIF1-like n=1 Tax=Pyrus x bretschneideri TaxID=225117 RepID=UPI002030C312|nr:telomere-associated protein RIF1-like [Pyrus x bretschneideri]
MLPVVWSLLLPLPHRNDFRIFRPARRNQGSDFFSRHQSKQVIRLLHPLTPPAAILRLPRFNSNACIRPTVADVRNNDEEIATQALECLGFMIYHPSIVAEIAADDVKFVLDSLAKLLTTTKMKSVCNLGVWCISIQQLSTPLLAAPFHSLLLAIVHAIDNPISSLSTTFEAIQAVIAYMGSFSI